MGIARALRRRFLQQKQQPSQSFEERLRELTRNVEDATTALFEHALHCHEPGQALPNREHVEATGRHMAALIGEPAFEALVGAGQHAGDVAACRKVISAHVELTFQAKWAALARFHAGMPVQHDGVN